MNFILLYGPPAVGKLTVAKELKKLTGYKLLHNHLLLNPLSEFFGFDHPIRKKLEPEFYFRVIEEAVTGNFNMIITSCKVGAIRNTFYKELLKMVEDKGGTCSIVQLTAPIDVLLSRVEDESRVKHHKISTKERFQEFLQEHPEVLEKIPDREQLVINTQDITPHTIAMEIIRHYNLG